MTPNNCDRKRRDVLKTIGATAVAGGLATGVVMGEGNQICWQGHGSEVDVPACVDYHFVLTDGGGGDVTSATLSTAGNTYPGEGTGGNTFHFRDVAPLGSSVCVTYEGTLGKNAKVVLSECDVTGYQVDLIHGDPIQQFDPNNNVTYNDQDRLLQAYWSGGGLETVHFNRDTDAYQHCLDGGLSIASNISVSSRTATASIDPGDNCDVSDFALVSYSAPHENWQGGDVEKQQRIYDQDLSGNTDGAFSVSLPPLQE